MAAKRLHIQTKPEERQRQETTQGEIVPRRETRVLTIQEQSLAIAARVAAQRQAQEAQVALRERQSRRRTAFVRAYVGETVNERYADFFGQVAALMASGRTIEDALRAASTGVEPQFRPLCLGVADQVAAGVPLSQALAHWEHRLPEIVVPIVEVGERTGSLQTALFQVTEACKKAATVDHKFDYSVKNPGLIIPLGMMLTTAPLGFLIENSALATAYVVGCVLASIGVWTRRDSIARRQPRNAKKAQVILKPTRDGMAQRQFASARWGRTFAILCEYGVPISTALEVASRSARNEHYKQALLQAAERTRQGWTLYDSLAETRLLPPRLLNTVQTGELTGDIGPALDAFADFQEEDAKMLTAQAWGMRFVLALFLLMAVALCTLSPQVGGIYLFVGIVITALLWRVCSPEVHELKGEEKREFQQERKQ